MTPALLPVLGLLVAIDAPPAADTSARAEAAQRGSSGEDAPAKAAGPAPAAAKAGVKAAPPPASESAAAHSAAEVKEGELLLQQKCTKCHDLSVAYTSDPSAARWKGHLRRMAGAAINDEQAGKIREALKAYRARSGTR